MDRKIKVVLKRQNQKPEIKEINADYDFLSTFCEGLIDIISLPTNDSVDIIFNDEFLYNGMKPNIVMPETEGVLCGPLIFAGYNPEDGSTISLTNEQIEDVLCYIKDNEVYNMSIERALLYSKMIRPFQESQRKVRGEA